MCNDDNELNQLHNSDERFDALHNCKKFLVLERAEEVVRVHYHVHTRVDDREVDCHIFCKKDIKIVKYLKHKTTPALSHLLP